MAWKSMCKRTDESSCKTCNGYGGVYDDDTISPFDGLPVTKLCPQCQDEWGRKMILRYAWIRNNTLNFA